MDFTLTASERLGLIERDLQNMAACMYPFPGNADRYVIEACWPDASREEWQHAADYVAAHPEITTGPKRHIPDVRAGYEAAAKELSHLAAQECAEGQFDRALDLLRQAFVAAPNLVGSWRHYVQVVENRRHAATAAWVREEGEHPRWVLPGKRNERDVLVTAAFQITDEAIRTFGQKHVEQVTLRGLPKLPEQAWAVSS
ncbi:MAG: hypothetical protein JWO67_4708 [Streptosporangiaceae bacterium]|nr:hypothetical protein [Streptosporangiaceae bacterium]